ncbi:hypothetical protein ACJEDT_26330 (plasmid) [Rhodococcoides fascians]|uniref:hypothetical protein n=1 Tax=Rhodococcoides fascians TaxID=1828 RepID=UPI0038998DF6
MTSVSRTTADIQNRKLQHMIRNKLISGVSLIATVVLALSLSVTIGAGTATADQSTCRGTPAEPVFPGYASDEVLDTATNFQLGDIRIRRGWYCVPDGGNEYFEGIGFGLDKVQHRHNIGASPYSTSAALTAVKWALESEEYSEVYNTGWGAGRSIFSEAQLGRKCKPGVKASAETCEQFDKARVIGVYSDGGRTHDELGGMPAGTPLGLQTLYCNDNTGTAEPPELRCASWVTESMYVAGGGT